jgi:hypothetical protein
MSQVTDALKQFIQGMAAGTEGGKAQLQQQAEANRLAAEQEYRRSTLANEKQRLDLQEKADQSLAEYRKGEINNNRLASQAARMTVMSHLAGLSHDELSQFPGISAVDQHGGGGVSPQDLLNPTQPATQQTPPVTGTQFTLPESVGGGAINAPTQADWLENQKKVKEAQDAPQLQMLQAKLVNAQQMAQERLDNANKIAGNNAKSREEIAAANRDAANARNQLDFLKGIMVANIHSGNVPGAADQVPGMVEDVGAGKISESDLKTQFGKQPAVFNQVINQAHQAGYTIPTDQQRDIIAQFAPAAEALRQIGAFNTAREQGVNPSNLQSLSNQQNAIGQSLTTLERELIKQRASGVVNGQMLKAYQPDMATVNPFTDTNVSNREKQAGLAKTMSGLINSHLQNLSQAQRDKIIESSGLGNYMRGGHVIGDVVKYKGKNVRISGFHPDNSFDYEGVK